MRSFLLLLFLISRFIYADFIAYQVAGTGYPIHLASNFLGADSTANYWSPQSFQKSNEAFRSQSIAFLDKVLPSNPESASFRYGKQSGEMVSEALLLVGGCGKIGVQALNQGGAWIAGEDGGCKSSQFGNYVYWRHSR